MFRRRIPLAWKQLTRQRGRFLIAVLGIAFAVILMLMQLGFQDALYDSNTRLHQLLKADLVLISPSARNLTTLQTFSRRRLFQAANHPAVKIAEALYIRPGLWKNPQTKEETAILVIGYNPAQPAFDLPEVNRNLSVLRFPDTLVFDRASRGNYREAIMQIAQGNPVTTELEGRQINLRGLYKVGASFGPDGSVMTSDQNFLRIFFRTQAGEVSLGRILLQSIADVATVAQELKAQLSSDVRVLTKAEFIQFEANFWRRNTAIGFIFSLGVGMGFIVGIIIVYQILYSDVNDHLSEYATLKAMGYRNRYLLRVVFEEALILSVSGFIPGHLISIGLYRLTQNATNLPLEMTLVRMVQVLSLTIAMCLISGAIAIRKLQSADPADIF
ncbi:MAG: ABC transporter permease DevC [Leptolyngbya sp. Prado105]|jgi:putative ABC transport system permease protein|nr:ABC transporter permease DevC [Leptolyngbya sp. Prado105]